MNLHRLSYGLLGTGVLMFGGLPALGATAVVAGRSPADRTAPSLAGLFHTIDVLEDVDDVIDGDFADIDPVREFTEDVEDAVDDVNDTIRDVTDINIYEPFTDVDDRVEDFVDDVDDTMRHISNDVEDWFD